MRVNAKKKIVATLILLAMGSQVYGQYEIPWWTVDGGGGKSSGGGYELRGTIAQPDASVQPHVFEFPDGSYYALGGGYWPSFNICKVDLEDLQSFVMFWLDSGAGIPADIDNSGFVDLADFSDLNFYWLGLCSENWSL